MPLPGSRPRALVLGALLLATLVVPTTSSSPAVAASPGPQIDLARVKIVNTAKKVTFTFIYKHKFRRPAGSMPIGSTTPVKPYWWGATIYFDTNPKTKGPEYGAFLTNQCGSGYSIGRLVRTHVDGHTYYDVSDKWRGGCGDPASCQKTAKVSYDKNLTSVTSISFRKVKGCYTAGRVRVSAEFTSGPFGARGNDWSKAYDLIDSFPRSSLSSYTGWTSTGHTHTASDKTPGFTRSKRGTSGAP